MRFAIVAHTATETTRALTVPRLAGVEPTRLSPGRALAQLEPGDVALGRIDVLPSVDGIEPGLWALDELAAHGVDVLNGADALRAAHDKLLTAAVLAEACLPHPLTAQLTCDTPPPVFELPVVIKPRFGSWGRDVMVCRTLGPFDPLPKELQRIGEAALPGPERGQFDLHFGQVLFCIFAA